jgi:FAD:protein FMN transferase
MSKVERHSSSWRPSRRDVLFVGIGGLAAAVPFARRRPLTLVRRNVLAMGTIAEFAVAHRDPRQAHAAIDAGIAALRRVEDAMSFFRPTSDVGRANLHAGRAPVVIGVETMHVLSEGLRWASDSDGAFDPCLGCATALWDVTHRDEPPATAEYVRLANRRFHRALELTTRAEGPAVVFHDPDVRIDLGGIAKGYGVDRAVAMLREHGIEHALVGAGGDLCAVGQSPSGEPWTVGIQSPDGPPDALAGTLRLENAAVATSGDYRQYFDHDHRRYHHLLDPATAEPRRTAQRSVSIVAATCMAADAGATLAYGAGPRAVAAVLARHGARVAHWI